MSTTHYPPLSLPNSPAPPARNYAPLHTTTAAHYIVIMHKCTVQMHPAKATILYALCIYVLNCGLGCKKCYINYYSTNYAFASNMQMYWTSVETKPGVKCWQLQRIQALELPNSPACKDEIMQSKSSLCTSQLCIAVLDFMQGWNYALPRWLNCRTGQAVDKSWSQHNVCVHPVYVVFGQQLLLVGRIPRYASNVCILHL